MKILFVATVRSHIGQFHIPFIKKLKELGFTVDAAYRDNSDEKPGLDTSVIDNAFEVPFSRSPYSLSNIKAYFVLKKILKNNHYDAVHCHTPMGAVVTRLAAKSLRKEGLKVIYTAHGFHFYNGASKKNWLIYYTVEKYLSKFTDCLITINEEDYQIALKDFSPESLYKVNGVGVDIDKFHYCDSNEKSELRKEYGFSDDEFILIYPANLTFEKNHKMLFEVIQKIKGKINIKLLCPGQPDIIDELQQLCSDMDIFENVSFLGYRRDMEKMVGLSDISVSASLREGLPVNLIEAMAIGNPIVATDVRGNRDLVENGVNGFLVKVNDSKTMSDKVLELYNDKRLFNSFSEKNLSIVKSYSTGFVNTQLVDIYKSLDVI